MNKLIFLVFFLTVYESSFSFPNQSNEKIQHVENITQHLSLVNKTQENHHEEPKTEFSTKGDGLIEEPKTLEEIQRIPIVSKNSEQNEEVRVRRDDVTPLPESTENPSISTSTGSPSTAAMERGTAPGAHASNAVFDRRINTILLNALSFIVIYKLNV